MANPVTNHISVNRQSVISILGKLADCVKVDMPSTPDLLDLSIEIACTMVNEHLKNTKLTDKIKNQIGIYLAAHFFNITSLADKTEGGLLRKETGDSTNTFQIWKAPGDDKVPSGLNATPFGSQALTLDSSQTLSKITTLRIPAQFKVYPLCPP